MLHSYEQQRVVSRASMRIKRGVQISEGQIIWAILYGTWCSWKCYPKPHLRMHSDRTAILKKFLAVTTIL